MQESGAYCPDLFLDAAADFIVALALIFNRRQLKPITLWTRIGSAITTGIPVAQGGDLARFEEHCRKHVMAAENVAANAEYRKLTAALDKYDDVQSRHFILAFSERLVNWMKHGIERWENRKAALQAAREEIEALETVEMEVVE